MKKWIFGTLLGLGAMHFASANVDKTINVKVGYSKIGNIYDNDIKNTVMYVIRHTMEHSENFNGHRVFGLGFGLKYNFPKYFFIGLNANLENTDNEYTLGVPNNSIGIKFSSRNSVNLIPIVGVSIDRFNIYAGAGISYNQINYLQFDKSVTDPTDKSFNNYKVHNWRGNFAWCAGIDANINSNASLGIEYKKTRIKFSFIEYPNSFRFKSHFKTDHHTVSVTFKYKF